MRPFEFLRPASVAEACAMLAEHGDEARPLAGGTSLVLLLRQRLADPRHVVHIGKLEALRGIRVDGEGQLRIGALATHAEVAAHPLIRERFPVIADMASQVANPQIRNVATLGGNLCYADPASDPPTCLVALGARVRVVRGSEEREIALEHFFRGYYETALGPGEVLAEVIVPPLQQRAVALYSRFITNPAEGRPLCAVALRALRDAAGLWTEVRLVLGAVVPAPARAPAAEACLTGRKLSAQTLAEAAELAVRDIQPLDDFRASGAYRRDATRVMVRRLLERAVEPSR
jgi:aerobic carbon-monoxide dehydrogenase medium subunit